MGSEVSRPPSEWGLTSSSARHLFSLLYPDNMFLVVDMSAEEKPDFIGLYLSAIT